MSCSGQSHYPVDFIQVMQRPDLQRAFSRFAKTQPQFQAMMYYCTAAFAVRQRYALFHQEGAAMQLDAPADVQARLAALAELGLNDQNTELVNLFETLADQYRTALTEQAIPMFYESNAFADFRCSTVTRKRSIDALAASLAQKLFIQGTQNGAVLTQALRLAVLGRPTQAIAQCAAFEGLGLLSPLIKHRVHRELSKVAAL